MEKPGEYSGPRCPEHPEPGIPNAQHSGFPWKVPAARLADLRAQLSAHQYVADPAKISESIVDFFLAA